VSPEENDLRLWNSTTDLSCMTDLELQNAELRAALLVAEKKIVKFNLGSREDPALKIIRRVLEESRTVPVRKSRLKDAQEAK
jgi:hypothetical protein